MSAAKLGAGAVLCALLCARASASAPGVPQTGESQWESAAAAFDGVDGLGRKPAEAVKPRAQKEDPYRALLSTGTDMVGRACVPALESSQLPNGFGVVGNGYGRGLLGGLLGFLFSPFALACEAVQALALTPVRVVEGAQDGDFLTALEPLRTVKNLIQDAVVTAAGMLNSAAAPLWNAAAPGQTTGFMYANDRLIFSGGPVAGLMNAAGKGGAGPSWHTIFVEEEKFEEPRKNADDLNTFTHEYVHNKQWQESYLFEGINHDFVEDKEKGYAPAGVYLNTRH